MFRWGLSVLKAMVMRKNVECFYSLLNISCTHQHETEYN
jgi:hypothetical protein